MVEKGAENVIHKTMEKILSGDETSAAEAAIFMSNTCSPKEQVLVIVSVLSTLALVVHRLQSSVMRIDHDKS